MIDVKGIDGKSPDEIIELAKSMGIELTVAQLEEISGGSVWNPHDAYADGCPKCGSHDLRFGNVGQTMWYTCKSCRYKWC